MTNIMIDKIDQDKLDDYIEENYSSREYLDIMKEFYLLKDNYPDIVYMYIYKFMKDPVFLFDRNGGFHRMQHSA